MGYTTGISNKSFLTIMFCLYNVSKNSKIMQTCMFSEIVRPKMGLNDPSPLKYFGIFRLILVFETTDIIKTCKFTVLGPFARFIGSLMRL